jgi:hypothetical protein
MLSFFNRKKRSKQTVSLEKQLKTRGFFSLVFSY